MNQNILLMRENYLLRVKMTNKKKNTHTKKNMFVPSRLKIILTVLISLLPVLGWVYLLMRSRLYILTLIIYFMLTFIWIMVSGFISCVFVHMSTKNRITKALSVLMATMMLVIGATLIYKVWG
jgi:uncharacterized membrane protein